MFEYDDYKTSAVAVELIVVTVNVKYWSRAAETSVGPLRNFFQLPPDSSLKSLLDFLLFVGCTVLRCLHLLLQLSEMSLHRSHLHETASQLLKFLFLAVILELGANRNNCVFSRLFENR